MMSDPEQLLEFACVELIQRNRRGDPARVEDYFKQYPVLVETVYALDLIDAEICVRKELGEPLVETEWIKRFPQYADAIRQLVALDVPDNQLVGAFASHRSQAAFEGEVSGESFASAIVSSVDSSSITDAAATIAEAGSVSLGLADDARKRPVELFPPLPIPLPKGFVIDSGVAIRPGGWLVRCHDENDRKPCAFKVVDVTQSGSLPLTDSQRRTLLDSCERAARVKHPVWVPPVVAACDGCFLGVVRPWMFAVPWNEIVRSVPNQSVFRLLAELAFCLHAAHQSACFHGNVCEENLFISHSGQLQLTDAIDRLNPCETGSDPARDDALMFMRLLSAIQFDPNRKLSTSLVRDCHQMLLKFSSDRLAIVGEWLIKIADGEAPISNLTDTRAKRFGAIDWLHSIFSRRVSGIHSSVPPPF